MREGMDGFATDTVNKENCFLPLAGRHTRYLRMLRYMNIIETTMWSKKKK